MESRIDGIPKLGSEPIIIDAPCYNRIRLALCRLGNPFRLRLTSLRGMDIILTNDAWICVDNTLYDLPILAWTEFNDAGRTALHIPVRCMLHLYHIESDLIAGAVLKSLLQEVDFLLEANNPTATAVSQLNEYKKHQSR